MEGSGLADRFIAEPSVSGAAPSNAFSAETARLAAEETTSGTPPSYTPTDEEQTLVEWAKERFADAGLELPSITVRFDPTRELCRGNEGLYGYDGASEHLVGICIRDSDSFAAQLERRRTLLHEFAHVWDTVNLTTDDRDRLNRSFGTRTWYSKDPGWTERGAEQFAEMFVLGLLDQPARQLKITTDCAVLVAAFRTVTGVAPLGPGQPQCGS